jgi:hypothetical protein
LLGAFFSNIVGVAWLSRPIDDDASPFMSLCCLGLQLEQGLSELVSELPSLGLGVPSFFIRACHGSSDRARLGSGSRPFDHSEHHTLLRATIAGPDPLEMAFWGQRSATIDWGAGSAPNLGWRPLLGPLLSSARPNSMELVGFWEWDT